jgi:hypothetical protein
VSKTYYFRDLNDQLAERAYEVRIGENPTQPEDFDERPSLEDVVDPEDDPWFRRKTITELRTEGNPP